MWIRTLDGKAREATLTTDHAASCHGVPVLVVNGEALGPGDAVGVSIVPSDAQRADLECAGYRLERVCGGRHFHFVRPRGARRWLS